MNAWGHEDSNQNFNPEPDDRGHWHDPRPEPPPEPLHTYVLADFAGQPIPERAWLVPDMIPDRNVTDLSADGGTGKSLLALQLCIAVVTGTDWIGQMPAEGMALYVSCEDEIAEIRRRIAAIVDGRGFSDEDLAGLHVADLTLAAETELVGPGGFTKLYGRLEASIDFLRPKLVVLDTRADMFGGNEISRVEVRAFVRRLRKLAIQYDLALLMLSHPSIEGIRSGTGQSGSTAWGNSVRSRLHLAKARTDDEAEPDPDLRVLTLLKNNYGATDTEIMLRWQRGVFRPDGAGPGTLDRMARERKIEERFIELLREFNTAGRRVSSGNGGNYAPKVFAGVDGTIGKPAFRGAMERLFAAGRLRMDESGRPSRPERRLVEVNE